MAFQVGGQDVSRETYEKLQAFEELIRKWTPKINLIAPGTIDDIWDRHICDSAQIYSLAPPDYRSWADIGSGGGLPGIVIAILAQEKQPGASVTLIESDQRKATFLQIAGRELDLPIRVIAKRIEDVPPQEADVVSARALSGLSGLLSYITRHLKADGQAILHKGKRFAQEIDEARKSWTFGLEEHPSLTDPDGRLLVIRRISRIG